MYSQQLHGRFQGSPVRLRAFGLIATFALVLSACSGGSGAAASPSAGAPAANVLNGSGLVKISFWHAMNGTPDKALQALVDKFNAANQGKIQVTANYQGNYDDNLAKYKAAIQSKQTPSLIMMYDVGTRLMIDSGQTIPMQAFIDADKFDVSDLQPNILGYYSIGGKLYSMPFNTSMPILYYNKTAFAKAGLDPNTPPTTLNEIRADAEKLTVKDASGNVVQYGFGAAIYGWFMEQFTAVTNQEYCDNGNGRTAAAAKVLVNGPEQVQLMTWWAQMVKDGLAVNTGRITADGQNAFKSGRVAINIESTGVLGGYLQAAQGKFDIGTGFYPKIQASDAGGPTIGGASLWIDQANHSPQEQRAAWEFVKFLMQPENQTYWHTQTGYFPVSKGALNDPTDKAWVQKNPQFTTAITQLQQTKLDPATQGCLLGVMPQVRQNTELGMEKAILGQATPQAALDAAVAADQPLIDQYNQAKAGN